MRTLCAGVSTRKYPSDLTDAQWKILKPLIPPAKPGGRPREVDMREVLNTLRYQACSGCQRGILLHDLLPRKAQSLSLPDRL